MVRVLFGRHALSHGSPLSLLRPSVALLTEARPLSIGRAVIFAP